MKHLFTAFIFFVLISPSIKAQDTLVLNSGKKILAKHIHLNRKLIYYKDYPSRIHDSIDKSKVNYVIHYSGWKIPIIPPPWYSPIIISPGIGISAIQYKFKDIITDTGANIVSFSPVYSCNIDYAPTQDVSIGIGVSWQTLKINPYKSYSFTYVSSYYLVQTPDGNSYTVPAGSGTLTYGSPDEAITETLTRLNMGVRILNHIRNDEVKDFYIGVRIGMSIWTDQSSPAGTHTEGNITVPSFQGIIGLRKDINNFLGFFLEGGLGTPYFGNAGIYYKVNTKQPCGAYF